MSDAGKLTLPELEMLRHALRIAAEDGSLFTEDEGVAAKRQDALYDRLRIKIDAALLVAEIERVDRARTRALAGEKP